MQGSVRRRQPARGTREKCNPKRFFQRFDVPAEGRLRLLSRRAAPERLPSRNTARKLRNSSQLGSRRAIRP
jgi:hypothetical protein